jgi:hypothetical protein
MGSATFRADEFAVLNRDIMRMAQTGTLRPVMSSPALFTNLLSLEHDDVVSHTK